MHPALTGMRFGSAVCAAVSVRSTAQCARAGLDLCMMPSTFKHRQTPLFEWCCSVCDCGALGPHCTPYAPILQISWFISELTKIGAGFVHDRLKGAFLAVSMINVGRVARSHW